ncbi:MAG: replication factor C small subunit [Thermoplasmata archaeon]|nr:MAG: replication factor C small subunit [Thermoplasmata archaeon]
MEDVWVEKYRPKKLDEVVGQDDIVRRLKAYVERRSMPHMLFAGPAGTGKTTCAIALARELFGENWRDNFYELNASDERGLDVVRTKIKDYARTSPMGDAEFKIIFLDEADALTPDAQAALRRTMERYTGTCRFILSCNYSSKIIEPIQSRCAVFRFKPIGDEGVKEYLSRIAKAEGLEITEDGLKAIMYVANGDLRKATNALQVAASVTKKIDADSVYKSVGMARPEDVKKLIETAIKGDFVGARKILDNLLIEYGLSGEDIVSQIHRNVYDLPIPDTVKIKIIDKIGDAEFRIVEGSNARIQLEALLAYFSLAGSEIRG